MKASDFRNDSFDIFRKEAVRSGRITEKDVGEVNEQLMDQLNLYDIDGNITRAGILLFHHNPERWIPGSYVKIGYFESDADLRYQDEIHGSLISQAEIVIDLLYTKYLKAEISYEGITRVETYPYPKEAIREAVLNSIVHKNYATFIPIQISVYEDKLYISNDCVFPDDWTVDNLLVKHRSRQHNPIIANTFFRAGFIEVWGRGIEKIKESCLKAGNPLPEYRVTHSDFMVKFTARPCGKAGGAKTIGSSLRERIIATIKGDESLSIAGIADMLGVPAMKVEEEIKNILAPSNHSRISIMPEEAESAGNGSMESGQENLILKVKNLILKVKPPILTVKTLILTVKTIWNGGSPSFSDSCKASLLQSTPGR